MNECDQILGNLTYVHSKGGGGMDFCLLFKGAPLRDMCWENQRNRNFFWQSGKWAQVASLQSTNPVGWGSTLCRWFRIRVVLSDKPSVNRCKPVFLVYVVFPKSGVARKSHFWHFLGASRGPRMTRNDSPWFENLQTWLVYIVQNSVYAKTIINRA